jgi:hypothetical protein
MSKSGMLCIEDLEIRKHCNALIRWWRVTYLQLDDMRSKSGTLDECLEKLFEVYGARLPERGVPI